MPKRTQNGTIIKVTVIMQYQPLMHRRQSELLFTVYIYIMSLRTVRCLQWTSVIIF